MPDDRLSERELREAEALYGLRPPLPCPICHAERVAVVTYKDGSKSYDCPNAKRRVTDKEREHANLGGFLTHSSDLMERLLREVRARRG